MANEIGIILYKDKIKKKSIAKKNLKKDLRQLKLIFQTRDPGYEVKSIP
jgi:hypothetical protein